MWCMAYSMGNMAPPITNIMVYMALTLLGRNIDELNHSNCWSIFGLVTGTNHRWVSPVPHYHEVMVIYPYPFLELITLFFSCIIFINGCICILISSHG